MIFQHEINSAENHFIKVANMIDGQKHDIVAVFQFVKKHRDQLVTTDILH